MRSSATKLVDRAAILVAARIIRILIIILFVGSPLSLANSDTPSANQYAVKALRTLNLKTGASAVAWNPNGKQVAILSNLFRQVTLWNVDTGEVIREIKIAKGALGANSLVFTPDGQSILVAADANEVVNNHVTAAFWDVLKGQPAQTVRVPFDDAPDPRANMTKVIALSPDGESLALRSTSRSGKQIALYLHKNWDQPLLIAVDNDIVNCMQFSPDGHSLAAGTLGGWLDIYDVRDQRRVQHIHVYEDAGGGLKSLAFSPDGRLIATGFGGMFGAHRPNDDSGMISINEPLQIVDFATGNVVAKSSAPSPDIWSISWSTDGEMVGIGSSDHRVSIRSRASLTELTTGVTLDGPIPAMQFAPDKPAFVAVSGNTVLLGEVLPP